MIKFNIHSECYLVINENHPLPSNNYNSIHVLWQAIKQQ
jgi:hypothetical protein